MEIYTETNIHINTRKKKSYMNMYMKISGC